MASEHGSPRVRATHSFGRLLAAVLVLIGLSFGLVFYPQAQPASAAAFAEGDAVVVTTDGLNLRDAPGVDAGVIWVIGHGKVLEVTGSPETADGYTWYPVVASRLIQGVDWTEGWVAGEFLARIEDPQGSGDGGFPKGSVLIVNTDVANVRTGPGLEYGVIRQITRGTAFFNGGGPVYEDGYSWYAVSIPDQPTMGWVAGELLTLDTGDGNDGGDGDDGWYGGFGVGDAAVVDIAKLNCRTGPGLSYAVAYVLDGGSTVTVLDGPMSSDGYHWFKLQMSDGAVGWSIGEGLAPAGSAPDPGGNGSTFAKGSEVVVSANALSLRSGPSLWNSIIKTLSHNTALIVSNGPIAADGYDWYEVETRTGDLGWVAGAYLAYASGGGGGGGWIPSFAIGSTATVDTPQLNSRTGPSLGYAVDHVLGGETKVTVREGPVSADGYHWFKLETATGAIGWSIGEGLR